MAEWLNVALYIFWMLLFGAMLVLLWAIWRNGVKRAMRVEQALIDTAIKSAKAAEEAAQAACLLACQVKIVEEEQRTL